METLKKYVAVKDHKHFCVGDIVEIRSKVVNIPSNFDESKFGKQAIEVEAFITNPSGGGGTNHFVHHYNSTRFAELLDHLQAFTQK